LLHIRRGRRKGFVRDKGPAKKTSAHRDLKSEKRFEQIELPAKLLDYFLRSDKSSIN